MTQDVCWMIRYNEVVEFMERERRKTFKTQSGEETHVSLHPS